MKQSNKEPAGDPNPVRRQLETSADSRAQAESDSGSGVAYARPEPTGGRFSQLGRQLKGGASRWSARIRDRLDNQAMPDTDAGANGVKPATHPLHPSDVASEGIRPVHMLPAGQSPDSGNAPAPAETAPATDSAVTTPVSGAIHAFAPPGAADAGVVGGETLVMSGTYIDLTQPPPGSGVRTGLAGSARGGSLTGFREAFSQTMQSYRRRRAADRSIRRNSRERVYRLKGYTTVAKVNRKFASERRQRLLRRILTMIIIFLTLILLFQLYNPIRDLSEWYRIIGIQSLDDQKTQGSGTIQSGSVTVTPPPTTATTAPTTTATTRATTTRGTTRR